MKITIISNLYKPYTRGGAEVIVENVINGLLEKKHDVTLITTQPFKGIKTLFPKKENKKNLNIYRFYPLNIFYYLNDYKHSFITRFIWNILDTFNIHSFIIMLSLLNKNKGEVVMVHNLKGIGYLTILAAKLKGLKIIYTIHDMQLITPLGFVIKGEENAKIHTSFFTKVYANINKLLFKQVDTVIAPSNYILEQHKDFFPKAKRIKLVNPIKIPRVVRYIKEGKWTELQFLFLGQIEKHKGIEFLLKSFKTYLDKNNYLNYKLHIVGEGTCKKKLEEEHASKNFIFHGKIEHEKLNTLFPKMDFLVFPSLCYENCPTVILESFSFDVPVIVSDIGGAGELVEHGKNGYLFEANNQIEFHEILDTIKINLTDLDKMKISSFNTVKKLNISSYVERMEGVIGE